MLTYFSDIVAKIFLTNAIATINPRYGVLRSRRIEIMSSHSQHKSAEKTTVRTLMPQTSGKPLFFNSDLLCEASAIPQPGGRTFRKNNVEVVLQSVDETTAIKIRRRQGHYATLTPNAQASSAQTAKVALDCLVTLLRQVGVSSGTLLTIGLGNDRYTVDALGARTIQKIRPERGSKYRLCAFVPLVESVTGISSFDVTAGVAARIKPSAILAIDTISTCKAERLGACFQLTDAGISPGGGIGNDQPHWDFSSLGIPVIGIGVPLMIAAEYICDPSVCNPPTALMPYTVDSMIERTSEILAQCINRLVGVE